MILKENNRLDRSNPNAVMFKKFLIRLQDSNNTEDNQIILYKKCSYFSIDYAEQVNRIFKNNNIIFIYTKNEDI